jgi:hypothetical protein
MPALFGAVRRLEAPLALGPPCVLETSGIAWLLETARQLSFDDFGYVRRPVVFRLAVSGESMPRQDDGVFVVRQHIFNVFLKGPRGERHRLTGKIIKTLFADIDARDFAVTGHVECEVLRTWLKIPVDITAAESGISLTDNRF